MLDVRHTDAACHEVHAVQLLNHVPFDASCLSKHVTRELQSLATTRNPLDSKHEAFIVCLVCDLLVGAALKPIEDLWDMEGRNVKLESNLTDGAAIYTLMLLGMF